MKRTEPTLPQKNSELQFVKGVGPKRAAALDSVEIRSIRDLLYNFPRGYLDRSTIIRIADVRKFIEKGEPVTVIGEVFRQEARRSKRTRKVIFFLALKDESGYLTCIWFEGYQWYKDAFENGEVLAVSAVPTLDKLGRPQFVHPQFDRLKGVEEDEPDWGKMFNTGAIIPKYRSSVELGKVGLDSRGFRRIIRNAVASHLHVIEESLTEDLLRRQRLPQLKYAIKNIHFPESEQALADVRRRLKFDELFYLQILLALKRHQTKSNVKGLRFKTQSARADTLRTTLPFELTAAQRRVLDEIAGDLSSGKPMNRLLQGDVGSGKTVVAVLTAL
ncbi:MAG: DNA helicase RecG, partial [Ignavibacteriales bacterium]|nr:DNA helicase RecG [Ignavibacteriales bacterium]